MQPFPILSTDFGTQEFAIEVPRLSDIPRLTALTKRFALGVASQRGLPIHENSWHSLIESEDVVCAKSGDGRMAGYYAANQLPLVSGAEDLGPTRAARNVLCNRFKLPEEKVSLGAQVVIDRPWLESDLRAHLLRALLRTVGLRYRCLFNVVGKDNQHEMDELPREGWRCFHEEDDTCYMMLDVAKSLRSLASILVLRIPDRAAGALGRQTRA